MLLSHLCVYAYKWAYECNSVPICNDRNQVFVIILGVLVISNIHIRMDVRSGVRIALHTPQECL